MCLYVHIYVPVLDIISYTYLFIYLMIDIF